MRRFVAIPLIAVFFAIPLFSSLAARAETLSLAQYLEQVKKDNLDLRSAESTNAALDLATKEIETAFSPYLNGDYSYYNSSYSSTQLPLNPSQIIQTAWDVSLSKQWGSGTLTSIGIKNTMGAELFPSSSLFGNFGSLIPNLTSFYYTPFPSLTISQPLWKNFWAKGTKATLSKVQASAQSAQALNQMRMQQTLFSAEQAYISLALARAAVEIQQLSLDRAQKILEWAQGRAASNLGDKSDVLQSQAAVNQYQIGLQQAQEDERAAERSFNTLRHKTEDVVMEELESIAPPEKDPQRNGDRPDIRAAALDLQSRNAAIDEIIDRYSPDISVFGTLGLNGSDLNPYRAFSQAFGGQYPSYLVGAKLSVNLDLPLYQKVLQGAQLAAKSGDVDLEAKKADLDKDWANLMEHWRGVKQRLQLATDLEALQKEKADHEKERFKNGRTTNFQVLQFEGDYAQARLTLLRVIAEARLLAAQAKFFNSEY